MIDWIRHRKDEKRARRIVNIHLMVLLFAFCGASCGIKSEQLDAPDMTEIRGDPIEGPTGTNDLTEATPSIEVPQDEEWWEETGAGETVMVSFDQLASFEYAISEPQDDASQEEPVKDEQIPDSIQALDGRLVGLKGFMLPTRLEGGLTTEFLLMRDQSMCCFGVIPQINEWVAVIMEGRGVRPLMDQAVTVFGRLHVGASYENGVLVGIYQMDGEDLAGPLDL
jgi:hypothetical protein